MVNRKIPLYIGKTKIPETRTTTIQLLECWGKLLSEYDNIELLYKELKSSLPTDIFITKAQDIAMHLATVSDEKHVIAKRKDSIYVGEPATPLGYINCKVAATLHRFFDEPDYIIRGKHPPIIAKTSDERIQQLKDNCCEEKKENEIKA